MAVLGNKRAELVETVPTSVNVVPFREYAQVPLPVMPTIAIPPTTAFGLGSVMTVFPVAVPMNVVRLMVLATFAEVDPKEGLAEVNTGALLTIKEALSVATLNAVVPPMALL